MMSNAAKNFNIPTTSVNILCNYDIWWFTWISSI